ncbi:MAG: DMT family transporter [Solirubrobacteraceae bacterium]
MSNSSSRIPAPLLSLTAAVSWGAMFPIAAHVMRRVDPVNLTAVRYGVATLGFIAILWLVEGRGAVRYDGRFASLFALGTIGFAGFNLLGYLGLQHTEPQNAAIIVSTMPLVTALVRWVRHGERPARITVAAILVALVGAGLVVTRGHLSTGWGIGDLYVFTGMLGWVVYTSGAANHPELSPLRYTALSAAGGTLSILTIAAAFDLSGLESVPSAADLGAEWPGIGFVIVFGALIAVVAWNAGVKRLGAANAALFMNLVPVTAFAIRIAGGYQPAAAELAGAALVIGALAGSNLALRRVPARARVRRAPGQPSIVRG